MGGSAALPGELGIAGFEGGKWAVSGEKGFTLRSASDLTLHIIPTSICTP